MAYRPAARSRKPARRVNNEFKPSSPWPHIEEFLESGGNIEIGRVADRLCRRRVGRTHHARRLTPTGFVGQSTAAPREASTSSVSRAVSTITSGWRTGRKKYETSNSS